MSLGANVKFNQVLGYTLKGSGALVETPNHCQSVPGALSLGWPGVTGHSSGTLPQRASLPSLEEAR